MFLILARRSVAGYAAALGGAASAFYLLTNHAWAGNWQGGVQAATGSLVFLLPGIVLAAGFDGRRYLRAPDLALTSGTRPYRMTAAALAASAAVPCVATLTLILTTFGVNISVSQFHFPGVMPILLPFAFVLAFTALGFLCGRFLSVVVLVPLAAVVGFLAPVIFSATSDVRAALLTPIDNVPSTPPLFLRTATVLAQVGIGIAVVLAVVVLLVVADTQSRHRGAKTAAVAAALMAVVTTIMLVANPQRHVEVTNAAGPSNCSSSSYVQVCVWPDHSPLLPPSIAAASALSESVAAAWDARPVGFVEIGLNPDDNWTSFATGTTSSSEQAMAYTLSGVMVAALACGAGGGQPDLGPDVTDREQWLLVTAGYLPQEYASDTVRSVLGQPPARQRIWWVGLRPDAVRCS